MRIVPVAGILLSIGVLLAAKASPAHDYVTRIELEGDDGPVVVTWLGNAGVMIESSDATVVVDAFYEGTESGSFRYTNLPENERAQVRSGEGRWADVDLVLATHQHFDHFNSQDHRRPSSREFEGLVCRAPAGRGTHGKRRRRLVDDRRPGSTVSAPAKTAPRP